MIPQLEIDFLYYCVLYRLSVARCPIIALNVDEPTQTWGGLGVNKPQGVREFHDMLWLALLHDIVCTCPFFGHLCGGTKITHPTRVALHRDLKSRYMDTQPPRM